ncbi:DUF4296 domain-containing protein [Belliella sp. DSM 111904]|uniref:DUF4296 domain-containing protein n=1 Tax=Belliella filtrata TaxID=2923435 RepID=A0ABS9V1N9_9BACT|nr:DUF4296 domain-containing protein [Belliella filtrata]
MLSCSRDSKPEGVLDQAKMIAVLIDIHLSEGYVSTLPINYDSSRTLYPMFEHDVFEKHNVIDTVFHKSLEYYISKPKLIDKIYESIIDSLNVIEKEGLIKETDELPN